MTLPSFTNLIVSYNSVNDILHLLADLRSYAPASKTVLIDNASKDQTVQLVAEHFPEVQLIRNTINVGFARAVNQGFDLCKTEYVFLLNPDIRIAGQQVFTALEACLEGSQRVAAAAPLQFQPDPKKRRLNFSWSYTNWDSFQLYLASVLQQRKSFPALMEVVFLNAGCLFLRRSAFYEVGKLNEKYFLYGEEPDLFLKFRRYGFESYLLPDVHVIHYRERSLKTIPVSTRVYIKLRAALNIIDAFFIGSIRIMADKLATRPRKKAGKKLRLT